MSAPAKPRPRHSTGTAVFREPVAIEPRHVIPPERRAVLEAPCERCSYVKWVGFDTGLCSDCLEGELRSRR